MWTSLKLWTRKTLLAELKGQFWWKFRKPNSRYNGGSEGLAPEVSERNKDFISHGLHSCHSCYNLAKDLGVLSSCPENLSEAKFKDTTPIYLKEEILRLHNITFMAWLLFCTFSQVYNENGEKTAEQKDVKMYHLVRKGI